MLYKCGDACDVTVICLLNDSMIVLRYILSTDSQRGTMLLVTWNSILVSAARETYAGVL